MHVLRRAGHVRRPEVSDERVVELDVGVQGAIRISSGQTDRARVMSRGCGCRSVSAAAFNIGQSIGFHQEDHFPHLFWHSLAETH